MDNSEINTTYKIRIIYVDGVGYGFDDVDLMLINLFTKRIIGEYVGSDSKLEGYYFTREDFDFY